MLACRVAACMPYPLAAPQQVQLREPARARPGLAGTSCIDGFAAGNACLCLLQCMGPTHPTDFTIAARRQSHHCIARVQFVVSPHPALHTASLRGAAGVPCEHALQAPVGWIGVTRRSSRCGFGEATYWRDGLLGWLQAESLVTVRSNARHPPHFLMFQIGTANAATT